jgi:MFS family permease
VAAVSRVAAECVCDWVGESAQRCFERDYLSAAAGFSRHQSGRFSQGNRHIEGLAESISSLLKLFAGYLSDRLGNESSRRRGLLARFIARPLLAFAQTWTQVLAIRLTDRVGKGIRTAPRDAMIADTVASEQRGIAFGFHRAMDHAAL